MALRKANVLTISLVVEKEKKVVGHIAFSPVTIYDGSPHGIVYHKEYFIDVCICGCIFEKN